MVSSQDGIQYLAPHITKRIVEVTIQDFCNLLGGGLVSYSTLSDSTVESLNAMPTGALICKYQFKAEDMLPSAPPSAADASSGNSKHVFYAIGWKGFSRTINVMCGKVGKILMSVTVDDNQWLVLLCSILNISQFFRSDDMMIAEIDHMKHQLDSLHVLR